MSGHRCPAPGCDESVPRTKLTCARHWRGVPAELQRELYAAYRADPLSDRHLAAIAAVTDWLNR